MTHHTTLIRPHATVTIAGAEHSVESGNVKLDAGAVPYAQASVTLPFLEDDTYDWLDPRDDRRISMSFGTPARPCDLGLRERTVDHTSRTVTLALASDEALLTDYRATADDNGARAHEGSLRAVVNYVLDKVCGASLEPGDEDPDVTAYWPVTNLLLNPTATDDITDWATAGNCTLFWASGGRSDAGSLGYIATAPGSLYVTPMSLDGKVSVTAGKTYVFTGYGAMFGGHDRHMYALIRWVDENGQTPWDEVVGNVAILSDLTWDNRSSVIARAPAGAVAAFPLFRVDGSFATEIGYVDDAMFYEGTEVIPAFTGHTADDANYEYEWSAIPDWSTSARIPEVERRPELFVWKAGVSAWEFLVGITSSVNMVLWCDERRRWYLQSPESRQLPSLISISASNTRDGSDTLSRVGEGTDASGVIVRYRWRDEFDIDQEGYDSAGTPERAIIRELDNTPYPGPGAAAAILARLQGTGRVQKVTAVADTSATPGMTASVSLPGAPDTSGRITVVDFDLADGFMNVDTSGQIDIMPGSIMALDGTIDSLAGTIDGLS